VANAGMSFAESKGLQATIARMQNTRVTTIPHQDFGGPDGCGCLDCAIRPPREKLLRL